MTTPSTCAVAIVSIHAPTGGATLNRRRGSRTALFQFTRPRGARHALPMARPAVGAFQFTRPRGARRRHRGGGDAGEEFQFTRPRGARRDRDAREGGGTVFQFTRPRGARPKTPNAKQAESTFQFTRPRGARLVRTRVGEPPPRFQFTRPRGARQKFGILFFVRSSFNSRAHGGRDSDRASIVHTAAFQFTRPRGARQRVGDARLLSAVFQFTRPRGARLEALRRPGAVFEVSIHAPTGGATPAPPPAGRDGSCFNSRAHGGRDSPRRHGFPLRVSFQFTRPRGARPVTPGVIFTPAQVSIHAPTGGATRLCQLAYKYQV